MNITKFKRLYHQMGTQSDTDTGAKTYSSTLDVAGLLTGTGGVADTKVVEAHTAADTLTSAEYGSVHTTVGASGTVVLTVPAATVGMHYYFYVGAAQELRIEPNGSETISLPSTGVPGAGGKYLTANAAGESVHIVCAVAGSWSVMGYTGTWTAEG